MQTIFYRFNSKVQYLKAGGLDKSEYNKGAVMVSVIGDYYMHPDLSELEEHEEEIAEQFNTYRGFLVNASGRVDQWDNYQVSPKKPMRYFA